MTPAAEGLGQALDAVELKPIGNGENNAKTGLDVWSNVTAQPHARTGNSSDCASIRKLLVDQLVTPVRWAQSCSNLLAVMKSRPALSTYLTLEMAPGSVLKGLMRRIDRACEVLTHDQPK
jgi:malonyl CoA-acyl carrier protein transacylase